MSENQEKPNKEPEQKPEPKPPEPVNKIPPPSKGKHIRFDGSDV